VAMITQSLVIKFCLSSDIFLPSVAGFKR